MTAGTQKPAGLGKPAKLRLDRLLVARGLAESREKAQALILAGQVLVNGQKAGKPGQMAPVEASLSLTGPLIKYASRAGLKLEAALDRFGIDVRGKTCLDVGASTGGFTDCLLQRGARKVYAVDVGTGQLDWRLRQDPRVAVRERTNARYLAWEAIGEPVDLVTCDVSFISVTLILSALAQFLRRESRIVVLAKPQFEAGRRQVGKGGIVRDPRVHAEVVEKVSRAVRELGFARVEAMESPVPGAEGNREFLVYGWECSRQVRSGA
ncbi:MAG TPA: TlyA family RNA methyltransferase [Bryobacterales bacterium]|nr:TlyA family RNA methyltransferase [Bryobacterales bacterium]